MRRSQGLVKVWDHWLTLKQRELHLSQSSQPRPLSWALGCQRVVMLFEAALPEDHHLNINMGRVDRGESCLHPSKLRKCFAIIAAGQLLLLLQWSQLWLLLWRHQREAAGNAMNNRTLVCKEWWGERELISWTGLLTAAHPWKYTKAAMVLTWWLICKLK